MSRNIFSQASLIIFLLAFAIIGFIILIHSLAAPNPNLSGDLNNDNSVNIQDLSILLSNYGTSNSAADINGDGSVNILDLSVLLSHYGQTYSGGGTISGASTAICSPSTCTAGSTTNHTLSNISNGDGTTSTRDFSVYRPNNLASSQTNLAPAVFLLGGGGNCGLPVSTNLNRLADVNRFIVVEVHYQCTNPNLVWAYQYITANSTISDEPYITAVVNTIKQCPASNPNPGQCADPQRLYMIGASSGASMTEDVMCSNENSSSFRGYGVDSAVLKSTGNIVPTSVCPSSDSSKVACTAIGQQSCFNQRYFLMAAAGTVGADAVLSQYMTNHLVISDGTVTGTGAPTTPTSTYADWAAGVLGCNGSRSDNATYKGQNYTFSYSAPCAFATSGKAIYTISIHNGAHYWNCQDSDLANTYYSGNPGEPSNNCPTSNQATCPIPAGKGAAMPNPPGLNSANCMPLTGGWGFFPEFWNFVSAGSSH